MRTLEYQEYFDKKGPNFADEQTLARRQRTEASQHSLGELSLVGATSSVAIEVATAEVES